MAFSSRLTALSYPDAGTFRGDNAADTVALAAWLEDRFIRQLPADGRVALRAGEPSALSDYLLECGAPAWLREREREGQRYPSICSWLTNVALQYEYGDKREAHEAAAVASDTITSQNADLLALAASLQVPPGPDVVSTLQAVLKAARQRPRPPPAAAPAPKRVATTGCAPSTISVPPVRVRGPKPPLAGLSEETFPLGFDGTGYNSIDDAARVLRMLHVRELRRLQDGVNSIIVSMQEFTANPKTDSRLGRVGK